MTRYVLARVAWAAGTALFASLIVFAIFHLLPTADPATLRAGRTASPEEIERVREAMGLNEPVWVQYWTFLKGVVSLDLGQSFQYNVPVGELIANRLEPTALLIAGSAVLWLAIGVPAGVISAVRRGTALDHGVMIAALLLISAPIFWLGLVSLFLFSQETGVAWPVLPGIGSYIDAGTFPARLESLLLPWMVMAAASAAVYARYMRSSLIETMTSDYVRTARSKGLSEPRVVARHGLRGALVPVVTLLGIDIGTLLAGNAILTETVFNIPGIGRLVSTSIEQADLPVIQGVVLVGALFIITCNLIVDLVYALLDPKVRAP